MNLMDDFETEDYDEEVPRSPDTIEANELESALRGLTLLGDDVYLGMQAMNIAVVDKWMMPLESEALVSRYADEGPDLELLIFLNAQSQMWMFALYELLRTWRERAKAVQKWASNGGLNLKIEALEKNAGFLHVNKLGYARQLKSVAEDPSMLSAIADDLARTHVPFYQLEYLRVALAKHEVSGKAKHLAYAPGYARIDRMTGSMSYQLSSGRIILGDVTRRQFADALRHIASDRSVPTAEVLASFDEFMKVSDTSYPGHSAGL